MTVDSAASGQRTAYWRRFSAWARRVNLERKLAIVLSCGAVISGVLTYASMSGNFPGGADPRRVLLLLNLDLILVLGLGALVARRLVIIWMERRRGIAGARLHARLVALFSLVAMLPAIVVAVFSVLFFNFALQGWFHERVSTAVKESLAVAEAYLAEHRHTISADIMAMAQDLSREFGGYPYDRQKFSQQLATQTVLRSLTEAVVFDEHGQILARAGFSVLLDMSPEVPDWAMERADAGEIVFLTNDESEDRVRAVVRLSPVTPTYLFVSRLVDTRVLAHMDKTRGAVQLYEALEGKRSGLQITFAAIFVVVAVLLLLAAVWVGLAFANQLTKPLGGLIRAAEQVRGGDLSARVEEPDSGDEIDTLSRAFNRMTGQLSSQQQALLDANRQLEVRRHFTEAVLSGVSAGVIGLDSRGRVTLPNRSACELLSVKTTDIVGKPLDEIVPEMAELVEAARQRPRRVAERQMALVRSDGRSRTLLVRCAAEIDEHGLLGFVITFDDISELLSAQRKAAWADVARRIAHEIKNPLTPIQLSAERLKRRYIDEVKSDPETFRVCTETIVRHVSDIGRMVDEFSSFARMPAPVMAEQNVEELLEQSVFLQRNAHSDIEFSVQGPEQPVMLNCDSQQIARVFTNLLQNAVDAIHSRRDREKPESTEDDGPAGHIWVDLGTEGGELRVEIADDGCGLPKESRNRLTEPYVTTREKGTGLGLAIVMKIMEDHGGTLTLKDRPEGGTAVTVSFPLPDERAQEKAQDKQDTKPAGESKQKPRQKKRTAKV
ncbi:MAG: PAS domain-containing sensor histidine kinase [Rhodovibrionaceae bacterium]|nr:PAS domain-containing sensor histidine kinase [Rhodovibrionaceae bacterium]